MSHSCCVAGTRSKVDWLRDFANRQKLGVEFACEYETGCASRPVSSSSSSSSAVVPTKTTTTVASSSSSSKTTTVPQQRRITPTLVRPAAQPVVAPVATSLEHRHVKVSATPVGPAQRLVQITRRQHELKLLARRMKAMPREELAEAARTGKLPYPSDMTMEQTVLAIERRALIAKIEGREETEISVAKKTKKPKARKMTVKNVTDLTNWLATLESRWIEKPKYGVPVVLIKVAKPTGKLDDERAEALLGEFVRLHPKGVYQPLVASKANNRITRDNSALIQLGANASLMKALQAHRVQVIGAIVMVLSDDRRAFRKVFDLRAADGFVDYESGKPVAPRVRAAAVMEEAIKSLLMPRIGTKTEKRTAKRLLAKPTTTAKRRRVLSDEE